MRGLYNRARPTSGAGDKAPERSFLREKRREIRSKRPHWPPVRRCGRLRPEKTAERRAEPMQYNSGPDRFTGG